MIQVCLGKEPFFYYYVRTSTALKDAYLRPEVSNESTWVCKKPELNRVALDELALMQR